jgi:peptide/nickel transport system permease protein
LSIDVAWGRRRAPSSAGAADPTEFYDAYTFDVEARSTWRRARSRFLRHRLATGSLVVLTIIFGAGLLARHYAPYGYLEVNIKALSQAPSWAHPFGTDQLGRDYFSRVLYAIGTEARIALIVGPLGALVGTVVGVVAGYFGGAVGEVLMRLTDLLLTLPPLILILVAVAYLHTTTALSISVLLACLLWMPVARIVRATTLELREKEYTDAARAIGASDLRIIVRHILPNAVSSIAVAATVLTVGAIALETTLAYLGYGISAGARPEKRIPSLGDVLSDASVEGLFHWWGIFFPGLVLVLILVSIYFVGDGLRDALDPSGGGAAARQRRWRRRFSA